MSRKAYCKAYHLSAMRGEETKLDICGDKLANKLKRKMMITILEEWPNNCKLK